MGYAMKYIKGGFPFHKEEHVDLRKKSGFGPMAAEGRVDEKGKFDHDDQRKEFAKSRYEMGEYKHDPTETDAEVERREDAEGK